MNVSKTIDATGLSCPMPIVKVKKAMDTINSGEVLEVLATDQGTLSDIPAWAKTGGHTILEQKTIEEVLYFNIQKS